MNLIFIATTGVHHALVAAQIYLGRLEKDDFRLVRHFADKNLDQNGNLLYIGQDVDGTEIYCLGAGKEYQMMAHIMTEIRDVLGFASEDLVVKPVSIPGDRIIQVVSMIPHVMGGRKLNLVVSNAIIARHFETLKAEVKGFKKQLLQ